MEAMQTMKPFVVFSAACCLACLGSCTMYTSGGNPFTNGPDSAATWESTVASPKTITIIDTRSGEQFFVMEVPVGQKLVIDFIEGAGDNDVFTPDLMTWAVFPIGGSGSGYGPLTNAQTVPDRWSRRLDVTLRPTNEYANPMSDIPLRVDEVNDQPGWWTSEGGELHASDPVNGYDP